VSNFIETISKEWATPWSFVTVVLVVGGVIVGFSEWIHSTEISGKNSTIEAQKAQLDSYKEKLSGATPEEAKAKIADLEARLGRMEPRTLSTEQRNTIKLSLAEFGSIGSSQITSAIGCTDCSQYAADFVELLERMHWRIMALSSVGGDAISSPKGLAILTPNPSNPLPEAKALARCFDGRKYTL
jgi:hypothetical protein